MSFLLYKKAIVVTGSSGLLGKQFCEVISKSGGLPIMLDIDSKGSTNNQKELKKKNLHPGFFFHCDITKEKEIQKIIKKILAKLNGYKLTGLVNNAAFNPQASNSISNKIETFNLKKWDKEIEVGLKGAFICTKVFGSYFAKKKKGSIINISSDLGVKGPKQSLYSHLNYIKPVTYSVVKHGIIGLTKYTCTYWARQNVRCNTLAPGGVYNNQDKKFLKKILNEIPAGRMANVHDFDGILTYLLSDFSEYTNGSFISVDGGRAIS